MRGSGSLAKRGIGFLRRWQQPAGFRGDASESRRFCRGLGPCPSRGIRNRVFLLLNPKSKMGMDYKRSDRVGDLLLELISQLLAKEVSDPRIVPVTLTGAEVSKDLRHARI